MTFTELQPALVDLDRTDKLRAMQFLASELAKEESAPAPVDGDSPADPTAEALAFYKAELRPILEPDHNGENVAIHVETKDYEVAKGPGHAHRGLRARHPEGFVIIHQIGPADSGLVARMRGGSPR
jgi:hypothetical protein